MRISALVAASIALVVVAAMPACSSKQGTTGGGGITGTPQGSNPNGVPYPSVGIGTGARGLDANNVPNTTRHGDVIQNFKFLGYPDGDSSKPMTTVALSDYYDPTAAKYKVLHIIAAAEWCGPCNDETSALVSALKVPATTYPGVVYLQALVEGFTQNVGATTADLNDWISKYHQGFAEVLDPEANNLGAFFDAAAVPFNADIDARSMEILAAGVGEESPDAVTVWLDWVNANKPTTYQ
jgi:hypothetical protein